LVFFGSQESVKKIWSKIGFSLNWSSHPSGIPTVKKKEKNSELDYLESIIFLGDHIFQQNSAELTVSKKTYRKIGSGRPLKKVNNSDFYSILPL
jgi:hypothetical protein